MRAILCLSSFALLATGCYYDNEEELYGAPCDATVSTFSGEILPIIQANCQASTCHGAGQADGNGELLNYEDVQIFMEDGKFRTALLVTKEMPQDGSLTSCELDLIEKWLDAGALND
jgi:hypothetical protein